MTNVEENLKYARAVASKYTLGAPRSSVDWQDAFSVASEALLEAAETWDPERGVVFPVYAWRVMANAVIKARKAERFRSTIETRDEETPAAEVFESPEDALIAAEERARGAKRLEKLGSKRESVEKVLLGETRPGRSFNVGRIALEAGVRISSAAAMVQEPLDSRARSARWYSRLSPEKRKARNDAKNAGRRAARAARAEAA